MGFSSSIWCQFTEEKYWALWKLSDCPSQVGGRTETCHYQSVVYLSGRTNLRQSSKQRFVCSASLSSYASSVNLFPLQFRGEESIYWHYCVVLDYTMMLAAKNACSTCQAQLVLFVGSPCRHFPSLGQCCGCTGPCSFYSDCGTHFSKTFGEF